MRLGQKVNDPAQVAAQRVPWPKHPGIDVSVRPIPPGVQLGLRRRHVGSKQRVRYVRSRDGERKTDREVEVDLDNVEALQMALAVYAFVNIHGGAELQIGDAGAAEQMTRLLGRPVTVGEMVTLDDAVTTNDALRECALRDIAGLLEFVTEQYERMSDEASEREGGKGTTS